MAAAQPPPPTRTSDPSTSVFSAPSRVPDDTVYFAIFPDCFVSDSPPPSPSHYLQSLHLQLLQFLSPHTSCYIWQHEPLSLSIVLPPSSPLPHLHGKLRFGDNIEDEWFTVFLLFEISRTFPELSIRVWDNDGEFLLIEAAFHLPRWIDPETSENRVFIRRGDLRIVPRSKLPNPSLSDSLKFLMNFETESRAKQPVQEAVKSRISEFPERARRNTHCVRVRVPVSVAQVLRHEPCLVSLAVEGFYDRDIDTMKYAARMEKFLSKGREEELVCVAVKMSRAMYAQLMQQKFQAPKWYPMPNRSEDLTAYMEAELGMKIACGFEMMYQHRKKGGDEVKGSTWEKYVESLVNSGYFHGLLPGSVEYKRLMENAEEYYKKSSVALRTREMISAPVRRIDDILAMPHSADNFKQDKVPSSDDDSWLYGGEIELNNALQERQKELDQYNEKHKKKSKETEGSGPSSSNNVDDFDLRDMARSMQAFVEKVSSFEGAEIPEKRDSEDVDLDVNRFLKDMESVMRRYDPESKGGETETEEGSSSDMEFDESDDEDDIMLPDGDNEYGEDIFASSYSTALNKELKDTAVGKTFVNATGQTSKQNEGTSNAVDDDMDEEFNPIDVDFNLVKNLLDSFSSQQGQPGPASNLLGLMGVHLPDDSNKGK
ncbi:Protein ecdysoneless homolog [Linum grandiflorum]